MRAELGSQDRDPAQRQPQLPGVAQLEPRLDFERLQVEVGLVEAIEQDQAVGPGVDGRLRRNSQRPSRTGSA